MLVAALVAETSLAAYQRKCIDFSFSSSLQKSIFFPIYILLSDLKAWTVMHACQQYFLQWRNGEKAESSISLLEEAVHPLCSHTETLQQKHRIW